MSDKNYSHAVVCLQCKYVHRVTNVTRARVMADRLNQLPPHNAHVVSIEVADEILRAWEEIDYLNDPQWFDNPSDPF